MKSLDEARLEMAEKLLGADVMMVELRLADEEHCPLYHRTTVIDKLARRLTQANFGPLPVAVELTPWVRKRLEDLRDNLLGLDHKRCVEAILDGTPVAGPGFELSDEERGYLETVVNHLRPVDRNSSVGKLYQRLLNQGGE